MDEQELSNLKDMAAKYSMEVNLLGKVGGENMIFSDGGRDFINLTVDLITRTWEEAIECHMK